MTTYLKLRNTVMSNPRGILNPCMSFSLQNVITSNVRMLFYRFDVYDLIEIEYMNDSITVYDFPFTDDRANYIRDNLDFLAGYFKSAGLESKRFLYNLVLKMPVSYIDFVPVNRLPHGHNADFAFILDEKKGYATEIKSVNLFTTMLNTMHIDKCLLSFFSQFIGIKKPKGNINSDAAITMSILSGLLYGVNKTEIEEQIDAVDLMSKFHHSITGVHFNSEYVENTLKKFKTAKLKEIITNPISTITKEDKFYDGVELYLTEIISEGLDNIIKKIKNENKVVRVEIDFDHQNIISMYILKGCGFVTPGTMKHLNYFRELFSSDNVELVLN